MLDVLFGHRFWRKLLFWLSNQRMQKKQAKTTTNLWAIVWTCSVFLTFSPTVSVVCHLPVIFVFRAPSFAVLQTHFPNNNNNNNNTYISSISLFFSKRILKSQKYYGHQRTIYVRAENLNFWSRPAKLSFLHYDSRNKTQSVGWCTQNLTNIQSFPF